MLSGYCVYFEVSKYRVFRNSVDPDKEGYIASIWDEGTYQTVGSC